MSPSQAFVFYAGLFFFSNIVLLLSGFVCIGGVRPGVNGDRSKKGRRISPHLRGRQMIETDGRKRKKFVSGDYGFSTFIIIFFPLSRPKTVF